MGQELLISLHNGMDDIIEREGLDQEVSGIETHAAGDKVEAGVSGH